MFSSLLRPRAGSRRVNRRPESTNGSRSPIRNPEYTLRRHATADFTEADDDDADDSNEEGGPVPRSLHDRDVDDEADEDDDGDGDGIGDEDNRRGGLPVLPLFSASHLGSLYL